MFFENDDKSYIIIDPYLYGGFFGYKNSYSYHNIDVNNILLFKKRDGKYFIRHNDVYYKKIEPLQSRINNLYCEMRTYANKNRVMYIYNDDKELFKKCRVKWNRITELIGINNAEDFVETILDDGGEFIAVDVHENASFVEGNPKDLKELVIVLDSVIYDYPATSLVQHRY